LLGLTQSSWLLVQSTTVGCFDTPYSTAAVTLRVNLITLKPLAHLQRWLACTSLIQLLPNSLQHPLHSEGGKRNHGPCLDIATSRKIRALSRSEQSLATRCIHACGPLSELSGGGDYIQLSNQTIKLRKTFAPVQSRVEQLES